MNSMSSSTHPPLGEQQVGRQRVAVIGLPHRPSLLEESMEGGAVGVVEEPRAVVTLDAVGVVEHRRQHTVEPTGRTW